MVVWVCVPFWTQGSYYGIGLTTFEPTMGITSSDNLYMSSYGNGPAGSTAIVQCSGLIEMTSLSDYSCANTYDPISPVPNRNPRGINPIGLAIQRNGQTMRPPLVRSD